MADKDEDVHGGNVRGIPRFENREAWATRQFIPLLENLGEPALSLSKRWASLRCIPLFESGEGLGARGETEAGDLAAGFEVNERGKVVIPWIRAEADPTWEVRRRKNPKRMGEVSQAMFLRKALSLGLGVALPWGDSEKYDFVVWAGNGERMLRVQVKATGRLHRRGYEVQPVHATRGQGKKRYTAKEIDVLAAHVQTLDVWYLLPIRTVGRARSLRFYPDIQSRSPRWEQYREKWELFAQ